MGEKKLTVFFFLRNTPDLFFFYLFWLQLFLWVQLETVGHDVLTKNDL